MITDRIPLAGLDAYFRDPATGKVNLGGITPTIRTAPLNKGKQVEISGIQILIEHKDLQPLLAYPSDNAGLPINAPLFKISVMKEMFPGLFADPFSHRVHNIAGYLDFNDGTLTNGRVMEVDGIPTICSTGKEECVWVSREYVMPDPISIDAIAWELATAKLTPPDSFHYKIEIALNGIAAIITIDNAGQMLKADAKRAIEGLTNVNINSFQITFTAKVFEDSYLKERHLPAINENIGRPLLRAINILEPVKSVYEINSLLELQNLCSDFHLFENPGAAIPRLTAILNLNAVLVNSEYAIIPIDNQGNKLIYDATARYEFVELNIFTNQFTRLEGRRIEDELISVGK
jgi:hypothetical protein